MAKKLTEKREETAAERGTVSIGGSAAAVLASGELRGLPVAAPGGYVWRPRGGEQVLVLKDGERCILGALEDDDGLSLAPGEVCIRTAGGAAIFLRNNGTVELVGTVLANGKAVKTEE